MSSIRSDKPFTSGPLTSHPVAGRARASIRAPSRAVGDALRKLWGAQEGKETPEEAIVVKFPVVIIDRGVSKPVPHSGDPQGHFGRG